MKKKLIILVAVILAVLIAAGIYSLYMGSRRNFSRQAAKPSLKFSIVDCDKELKDIDPKGYPPKEILKINWPDEKHLVVDAYVKGSCTGMEIDGDYQIRENDILNIQFRKKGGNIFSNCVCTNRVIFEIKDLTPRDYKVILEELK